MKCKNCDKEFESLRETAKYCSPKCRKLAFLSVPNERVSVPKVSVPEKTENAKSVKNLTREELYNAIDVYSGGDWIDSPEDIELERRLKIKTVKELEKEGYFVPNWKTPKRIKVI